MRPVAVLVILALSLQGCASSGVKGENKSFGKTVKDTFASDDPCANNKRNIGIAIGAVAGSLICSQISGKNKALWVLLCAAGGSAIGALIGAELDNRQCNLSKIQKKNALDMQMTPFKANVEQPNQKSSTTSSTQTANNNSSNQNAGGSEPQTVGLSVSVVDQAGKPQFMSGSDELQPDAKEHFMEIAQEYSIDQFATQNGANTPEKRAKIEEALHKKRILLIGHTDDTGNSKANADLSERRAKSVAKLFKSAGVNEDQLYYQGAGETMPIADNATEVGRTKNRRVEIVDLSDETTFNLYLQNRRPNTAYYRPVDPATVLAKSNTALPTEVKGDPTNKEVVEEKSEKNIPVTKTPSAPQKVAKIAHANKVKPNVGSVKQKMASNLIDFGGTPLSANTAVADIGEVAKPKSSFTLISEAQASEIGQLRSCNFDRPRNAGLVKSLKDGNAYNTNQYLPGVYDSSWAGQANGHLVALTHVAVLRDGGVPARKPELLLYQNYSGGKIKPSYQGPADVNTYRGDKALLYRVFSDGPVRCMDIVIPNSNPREAPNSLIVYERDGDFYGSSFNPKLSKK